MSSKRDRAKDWVNGYALTGVGIVAAAIFPGATSVALMSIEGIMCFQIGKIYKGDDYTFGEAATAASVVGLTSIAGQAIALEALNLVPWAGWAAKAAVAGGIIKALGGSNYLSL
ncbi:MAG: hypothetical protein ACK48A_07915 [Pseudanabaena sp.]|jgi:hypothetical protein